MTISTSDVNFRVLLVEDDKSTRRILCDLIADVIQNLIIDAAESIEEAMSFIENSRQKGLLYHVALLDFKLPLKKGMDPKVDVSLCQELKRNDVPIIHFSGWPEDPEIEEHMKKVHPEDEWAGVPVKLVKKTATPKWGERILNLIISLINEKIRKRLDAVFGEDTPHSEEGSVLTGRNSVTVDGIRCGTHAMIQLQNAIVANWELLDPDLRNRIKQTFAVVDLDGPNKRLSLFPA